MGVGWGVFAKNKKNLLSCFVIIKLNRGVAMRVGVERGGVLFLNLLAGYLGDRVALLLLSTL